MKPNQPKQPENKKSTGESSKAPSKLRDITYSKEAVDKVVNK